MSRRPVSAIALTIVALFVSTTAGTARPDGTSDGSTGARSDRTGSYGESRAPVPRQTADASAPSAPGVATVADSDVEYGLCGRVFPDPHAYWPSPAQSPGRSPWAKGNASCASTDFLAYPEMISGMTYMEGLFPKFIEFYELEADFGGDDDCATSTQRTDYCSAGLPRQGAPTSQRVRSDLYMIRITDERVPETNKKYFVFLLSIHGIKRAGAEAGVRAAEDLATWGYCTAVANGSLADNGVVDCDKEGARPYKLLEAQVDASINASKALKQASIWFVFPNPDGWRRGDPDNLARFFQRYNGNGVDLNRDWPTIGFTHKPYTPWSEPESRAIGRVLKGIRDQWDGGIDLHGQLIDRAFSFTLMGASQRDFAKNQRILQSVKGAWADAESRLAYSPVIKPNDAPDQCSGGEEPPDCDERMYGVQWGTVWDTIDYTVTGSLGDWIDSPLGLGADGIDNEMSVSHLANCGVGSCYLTEFEQLHVDGNKSLVYAMVNFSLEPEDTRFRVPGRVGYVFDPTVVSHPGSPNPVPSEYSGLPPQPDINNAVLSVANGWTYEFDVLGPAAGFYNGGLEGRATFTNFAGIAPGSVSTLILERRDPAEPSPIESRCDGSTDWGEINSYYNQSPIYLQAGAAVHANLLQPGDYRICLTGGLTASATGIVDLDIDFASEKAWPDPGQRPYSVSNMDFFSELREYMEVGQLRKLRVGGILSGDVDLDQYRSIVIADDALPKEGATAAERAAWGAALRSYAENGGNVVLTDGAMAALSMMGLIGSADIVETFAYAGYIGFTRDGGSTDTYGDPLAENVNQPGAAEGTGHRHQTYEPVPIGIDIGARTSCSGANCTSPIWTVRQAAWEAAGGRTVGTSGSGRVTLGELSVGDGVVRVIGALLPMPSDESYHPYGLSSYALTYSGYQVLDNALEWGPPLPDLHVDRGDVSFSDDSPESGDRIKVFATIHNTGEISAQNVVVRIEHAGQLLARRVIANLPAGGQVTVQAPWDTDGLVNRHHADVLVDPADVIAESDESDNIAVKPIDIRPRE